LVERLPRRSLGTTGLEISSLGLGTVKFGRNTGVKYPHSFALPTDQSLEALLDSAKQHGINYLDTAPSYGESELRLGKLLKPGCDHWVISTKVGEYFVNGESHYDFSDSATSASVELSLKRLGREQLDIVFVHSNGSDRKIIQSSPILACLAKLKEKGLIKAIGFSGKDAVASCLAIDLVDVFMVTLNQSDMSQTSLLELCEQRNKGVVIKKALSSGHDTKPSEAIKFATRFDGVTSVIVGTINGSHLEQNIIAAIEH
jgi:aryl-alcohol dehydrogenase-like predicted oxidoreductase